MKTADLYIRVSTDEQAEKGIRNPLNSIIGFSEQLSTSDMEETHRTQVEAINSSSQILLGVVNEILDFSKLEIGKVTFAQTVFSPARAIREVCNSMRVQADQKSLTLITNIQIDDDTYVNGDPLRLKQVIMNLISNSIKFTARGSVTVNANIRIKDKITQLSVSIIDTGIGISADDQQSIFEEFTQVYDSAANKNNKGTGLGLAICKKIIEAQGGKIGVSSTGNDGAKFNIEIPFLSAEELPETANPILNAGKESLKGLKVLVADDNQLNILLAVSILKKLGLTCSKANDGKEAFDQYVNNRFDIILTDIQMPNMDGIELTKKIRSSKGGAQIPIVGLTANIMPEDNERYMAAGMNAVLIKPFKEQDLVNTLLSALKK